MESMPWYLIFLHSFPEAVIIISLGMVLLGLKFSFKHVLAAGILTALASFFIRSLPVPYGVNVLIQLPVMVILVTFICRVTLGQAFLSNVLGLIILVYAEVFFNFITSTITGLSVIEAMQDPLTWILFPLPEFIILGFMILLIHRYRSRLVILVRNKYFRLKKKINPNPVVFLVGLVVVLIAFIFYYQTSLEGDQPLSKNFLIISMLIVILATISLSLLLSQKYVYMEKQKKQVMQQQLHIDNLQEMMQVIRAQRHDFVNHIQVLYGLLSLNHVDGALDYMSKLYKDVQISGDVLQLGNPELSALLLVKVGNASRHNISFNIDIDTSLNDLRVSSLDVVTVVGNLVNNALEAVENLEYDQRRVMLRIFKRAGYFIIQTHNPGWIPPENRNQVFISGYSTKGKYGERGIGLASVKHLAEKYGGQVLLSSHPQRGTRFTVCYPSLDERRKHA